MAGAQSDWACHRSVESNLTFTATSRRRSHGADLVQENGRERIDFKQKLYGSWTNCCRSDVIIASSSSGLP